MAVPRLIRLVVNGRPQLGTHVGLLNKPSVRSQPCDLITFLTIYIYIYICMLYKIDHQNMLSLCRYILGTDLHICYPVQHLLVKIP